MKKSKSITCWLSCLRSNGRLLRGEHLSSTLYTVVTTKWMQPINPPPLTLSMRTQLSPSPWRSYHYQVPALHINPTLRAHSYPLPLHIPPRSKPGRWIVPSEMHIHTNDMEPIVVSSITECLGSYYKVHRCDNVKEYVLVYPHEKVNINQLVQAGFLYKGDADVVWWFACLGRIMDWLVGDDPDWIHKALMPSCTYVRWRFRNLQ